MRPTIVACLGSDEALPGLWNEIVEGALERGYTVVMFEGPGQQSMLFERDILRLGTAMVGPCSSIWGSAAHPNGDDWSQG